MGIRFSYLRCDTYCDATVRPAVRLDDFVRKLGNPAKVYSYLGGDPDLMVILVFVERGIIAHAFRPVGNNVADMTPDMEVRDVFFYRARTLEGLSIEANTPFDRAQDWAGFGPVKPLGKFP